jgi:hypothetical protein
MIVTTRRWRERWIRLKDCRQFRGRIARVSARGSNTRPLIDDRGYDRDPVTRNCDKTVSL